VIIVLNIDIILTKTHHFASDGIYLLTGVIWITFIMDECVFLELQKLYLMPLESWEEPG